jgi:hypothetical protein
VRLLQLVSVVAEAAGEALRPHLGALAASLPQVWEAATAAARRPDADTGSVARLHSALMAVMTHLVGKLRGAALGDAGVQGVLYPLLQYATDPGSGEADVLLEEALKLWAVVQGATPAVTPQLIELLPRMAALLRRGRDNTAAFQLIEGYLLLGGGAALQPYGEAIATALTAALAGVARTVADACAPAPAPSGPPGMPAPPGAPGQPPRGPGGPKGSLASEVTQEGLAAAALVDVFLQVRGAGRGGAWQPGRRGGPGHLRAPRRRSKLGLPPTPPQPYSIQSRPHRTHPLHPQLYPADVTTLLAGSFTAMGCLIADPRIPTAGVAMKAHNVMEGFLEVLGRLFIAAPNTWPALLQAITTAQASSQQQQQPQQPPPGGTPEEQAAAVQQRFLDRWLSVANVTLLEGARAHAPAWAAPSCTRATAPPWDPWLPRPAMPEHPPPPPPPPPLAPPSSEAIGVRHMAMLGRFRRRMAAAGLAALINSGALSAAALDPKSLSNLTTLMIKARCDAGPCLARALHTLERPCPFPARPHS